MDGDQSHKLVLCRFDSYPRNYISRSRSVGGAPVLKTGSPKGYVGSNPICGVVENVAQLIEQWVDHICRRFDSFRSRCRVDSSMVEHEKRVLKGKALTAIIF